MNPIEKLKNNASFIIKTGNNFMGFSCVESEKRLKNKNAGNIKLYACDTYNKNYVEIDLGNEWVFFFSELIDLYNSIPRINYYSHQWNFGDYIIRVTHFKTENTLMMIKHRSNENTLNIILENTSFSEVIKKIIEVCQKIENFKFTILAEDEEENLCVAKIDNKKGTIITSFNGVNFGKPHLSESDKYQIKYSCIHRILYGRWLTVHTERVNISFNGIITTVDEEYELDKNEKNKSSFIALILLASLCFNKE